LADPAAVSVVIPAMDESATIGDVVTQLRASAQWREILVIDDGSTDQTAERARAAGATGDSTSLQQRQWRRVKTGIRTASGDFILIMDGDGQHPPEDAVRIVTRLGEFDLVIGARTSATQATASRRAGNAMLNRLASYLTSHPIPDLTSGFRGARATCLREFIHLLPNGFSAPTTTTLAFIRAGYNVAFVPVAARQRVGNSHVRVARDGAKFFLILLKIVTIFSPLRIFVPLSVISFVAGLLYGLSTVATSGRIANGAVILIMFAVIVFLVGLVSEQVSSLRVEGPRQ
jgi:glycosyltransferase involved in cell wall biosynthesis